MGFLVARCTLGTITILTAAHVVGCVNSRPIDEIAPDLSREEVQQIRIDSARAVDILFVIDNSSSMGEEQRALASNFPQFMDVLRDDKQGLPSVHIGVVSTDVGADPTVLNCDAVGDNGQLQATPHAACNLEPGFLDNAYIADLVASGSTTRTRNYRGDLSDAFSCIAQIGTAGCDFEQPLESLRRALSPQINPGFLREDAYLAVIIITDEDDCSTRDRYMFAHPDSPLTDPLGPANSFRCFEFGVECAPDDPRAVGGKDQCVPRSDSPYMFGIDEYVEFLKSLKDDPSKILVAGIIGEAAPVVVQSQADVSGEMRRLMPSCSSSSGSAAPPVRLAHFFDQFPDRNSVATICDRELSDALILIAEKVNEVIGQSCFSSDIDLDPAAFGVQHSCAVSDQYYVGSELVDEVLLPACSSQAPLISELPCWYIRENRDSCSASTPLEFVVERSAAIPPPGPRVKARCLVR